MIVAKDFIWLHMGKTGGNMFHYLMNKYYQKHIIFQHSIDDPLKHCNYRNIPENYKTINNYILGFRKLPSWIISHNRHHHSSQDNTVLYEATKSGRLMFQGKITNNIPDNMLYNFISIPTNQNIEFIRQEFLLQDFVNITSKYFIKNDLILDETTRMNQNNVAPKIELTQQDIDNLYKNNPSWSSIEKQIY